MTANLPDALSFLAWWVEIAGYLCTVWTMKPQLFDRSVSLSLLLTCLIGLTISWPLVWLEGIYAATHQK